jgi:hypothetical protein
MRRILEPKPRGFHVSQAEHTLTAISRHHGGVDGDATKAVEWSAGK